MAKCESERVEHSRGTMLENKQCSTRSVQNLRHKYLDTNLNFYVFKNKFGQKTGKIQEINLILQRWKIKDVREQGVIEQP